MKTTLSIFVLFLLATSGCAYNINKTSTITYTPKGNRYFSVFEHSSSSSTPKTQASIGDPIFEAYRFYIQDDGKPKIREPWSLEFPTSGGWYSDFETVINNKTFRVFRHNNYYKGEIGFILDSRYKIPYHRSVVRIPDGKSWKSYSSSDAGTYFFQKITFFEKWGIRYAGRDASSYIFETFSRGDANVSTITQSIKISDADFFGGFVIRGVKITGRPSQTPGVINFVFEEKFNTNLDSDVEYINSENMHYYMNL